jgi:hypothetical protein
MMRGRKYDGEKFLQMKTGAQAVERILQLIIYYPAVLRLHYLVLFLLPFLLMFSALSSCTSHLH